MALDQAVKPSLTVGICIGTYNQGQYLRGSVESAIAQAHPIQEIWVVDDCSTDDTPAIMAQLCREYPQIRYHRHEKNVGPVRNLSWALARPETDLVVRLDSDDRLEPQYVAVLATLMEQYPQAGYAHCNVWETDGDGNRHRLRQLMRTLVYEGPEDAIKSNNNNLRTAANCLMFRKKALEQNDYYLPHPTWTASEDWDLALRMAVSGWGNVFSTQVLSNYRQWDDPAGVRAKRKIMEVSTNTEVFKGVLIPAYEQRGWNTDVLKRNMRRKAVNFADSLDSPRFSAEDRAELKKHLVELGGSTQLSLAISAAEMGLNPVIRSWKRAKKQMKDTMKRILRPVKAAAPTHPAAA